jgi:hypothetical protein
MDWILPEINERYVSFWTVLCCFRSKTTFPGRMKYRLHKVDSTGGITHDLFPVITWFSIDVIRYVCAMRGGGERVFGPGNGTVPY